VRSTRHNPGRSKVQNTGGVYWGGRGGKNREEEKGYSVYKVGGLPRIENLLLCKNEGLTECGEGTVRRRETKQTNNGGRVGKKGMNSRRSLQKKTQSLNYRYIGKRGAEKENGHWKLTPGKGKTSRFDCNLVGGGQCFLGT